MSQPDVGQSFARRRALTLLGAVICFFIGQQSVQNYVSLQAVVLGAKTYHIALITASFVILPLMLAIPAGALIDRKGPRLVLSVGLLGRAGGTCCWHRPQTSGSLPLPNCGAVWPT